MNNFIGRRGLHLLLGAVLAATAGLSHAQYVWVNEKGVRQISDKAPPASVPVQNIIRAPAGSMPAAPVPAPAAATPGAPAPKDGTPAPAAAPAAGTPAAAAAAAKAAADAKLTPDQVKLAEREADYKKRQKEAAEKAEKDKAERKAKADKKANCELAKQYRQTLASDMPIVMTSEKGEQTVLSDADRKKMSDNTKRVTDNCR